MQLNIKFRKIDDVDGASYSVILPDNKNKVNTTCFFSAGDSSNITLCEKTLNIRVSSLSFEHEIYKPFKMNLELVVKSSFVATTDSVDSSISLDIFSNIVLELYRSTFSLDMANARSYESLIVTDIKFSMAKSASSIYIVNMELHSPDYVMTLNKSSKCYTGKRLSEIVSDVDSSFNNISISTNKLSFLAKQTILEDGTVQKAPESILPYIVQYQESSFDFLCRIARRYGELVFYSCEGVEYQKNETEKGVYYPLFIGYHTTDSNETNLNTIDYVSIDYHSSVVDLYREQVNMHYRKQAGVAAATCGDVQTSATVSQTNTRSETSGIYPAKGAEPTINNYGVNRGRDEDNLTKRDVVNASSSVEDYNTENLYVKNGERQNDKYSEMPNFIVNEVFYPSLAMAGLNSPTLALGLATVGLKSTLMTAGFAALAAASKGVYEDHIGDGDDKLAPFIYRDDTNLINSQFTATIETYSEYASSNKITINYGATSSADMMLGRRFKVTGMSNTTDSQTGNTVTTETILSRYVITSIHFSFDGTTCDSRADAILVPSTGSDAKVYPPKVDFPLYREAKSQLARVVDNIDPSGMNRVRVKYPWQAKAGADEGIVTRLENSTPWIRMVLPMASSGGTGLNFMPAANDEVMVSYQDGDIERPYIDGLLFSETSKPVNNSAANTYKYIKSTNGHTLTFYDNPDPSDFVVNMMPFSNILKQFYLPNSMLETSDKNSKLAGYTMISDKFGMYNMKLSTDERKISISSPYGTVAVDAFEGISLTAPNGNIAIKGKNIILEAGDKVSITSGANVKNFVWNNMITELKNIPSVTASTIFGAVVDLSFFRTVYESFFRPLGGTMLIKSHRNVLVEAGSGDTMVKSDKDQFHSPTLYCIKKFGDFMVSFRNSWGSVTYLNDEIGKYKNARKEVHPDAADGDKKVDINLNLRMDDLTNAASGMSITNANKDNYLPDIEDITDVTLFNYPKKTYNCEGFLEDIDDEIKGYSDKLNTFEVAAVKRVIEENQIKRKNYLEKVKTAVECYDALIKRLNVDAKLVKLLNDLGLGGSDLTIKYNKAIFNFVQGNGDPLGNAKNANAKGAKIPDLFKSLLIGNKDVAREAYCILMIHFAHFIRRVKFYGIEDGIITDLFQMDGNVVKLKKGLLHKKHGLDVIKDEESKEKTMELPVPLHTQALNAVGVVYKNWGNILYTLRHRCQKIHGYWADQGLKSVKSYIDLGTGIAKSSKDFVSSDVPEKSGVGNIQFSSNAAYTSRFQDEQGRFAPEEAKGQSSQLAIALKVRV